MYGDQTVGAGLLANAVDQLQRHLLTHRIREQASSHSVDRVRQAITGRL